MVKNISVYVLLCLLLQNYLSAQNLVPNPGFEEHDEYRVIQWIQPTGGYYHFQYENDSLSGSHSGSCVNGICLRNNFENEYLQIKLKERLKKDQNYYLKMYVRLSGGFGCPIDHIDWYFRKNDSLMYTQMGYFYLRPLVKFNFPKDAELKQWILLETTYIAKGTEQFLTVGHFAPEEETIKLEKEKAKLKRKNDEELASKKKRTKKDDEEFRNHINEIAGKQSKRLNSNNGRSQFFFDDFCLAAIKEDGSHDCEDLIAAVEVKTRTEMKNIEVETRTEIRNIFFEEGKATLLEPSFPELDNLYKFLLDNPSINIQISGHTDNKGKEDMNLELSEKRAKAVVDYLVSKGIKEEHLSYKGFGSSVPIATNDTEEGRTRNRRVEFTINK